MNKVSFALLITILIFSAKPQIFGDFDAPAAACPDPKPAPQPVAAQSNNNVIAFSNTDYANPISTTVRNTDGVVIAANNGNSATISSTANNPNVVIASNTGATTNTATATSDAVKLTISSRACSEEEEARFVAFDQVAFVASFTQQKAAWQAAEYTAVNTTDRASVQSVLGLLPAEDDDLAVSDLSELTSQVQTAFFGKIGCLFLPFSLDLRSKYTACTSIRTIRNQGNCGSCWAFASMNSLSDRYCIKYSNSLGPQQRPFSPEDTAECAPPALGGHRCSGGQMYTGYAYAKNIGVCTGEEKANIYLCKPYYYPSAAGLPACQNSCANTTTYSTPYVLDRYKVASYSQITGFNLAAKVQSMMCALNTGGTIIVGFTVYQDFFNYVGGVYHHVSGGLAGRHAVRVIGYGTFGGVKYWLCANSWGTTWGLGGYFRIRKGVNECQVEQDVWQAFF